MSSSAKYARCSSTMRRTRVANSPVWNAKTLRCIATATGRPPTGAHSTSTSPAMTTEWRNAPNERRMRIGAKSGRNDVAPFQPTVSKPMNSKSMTRSVPVSRCRGVTKATSPIKCRSDAVNTGRNWPLSTNGVFGAVSGNV